MARPVSINIPHQLGQAEARRRIEQGFAQIQSGMTGGMFGLVSFKQSWQGDRLQFEGGGLGQCISGRLEILPDSVQLQIDLPALLAAIADRIAGSVKKETQKLLEKK
ncbi:MAG: polyhydroxyalkanoic acid system family protein [Planctomycetaceae bacterium]|nr:polyhydroxyalkanoic acid system family protein [Planctomycetaceae bacterium]